MYKCRRGKFLNRNIFEFFPTTHNHKNAMIPQSCTIISFKNNFLFWTI